MESGERQWRQALIVVYRDDFLRSRVTKYEYRVMLIYALVCGS